MYYVIVQLHLYLLRLIKTDLKCLFVEVKFYSDFSEKNVPAFEIKCGHV